jgi:FG-GAP-like repeat
MNKRFFNFGYFAVLTLAIIGFNFQSVLADDSAPTAGNKRVLDFDGDGKTDHTVVRTIVGGSLVWYANGSSVKTQQFGLNNDGLVPEYYDDDNKADIAVWRQGDFNNPQGIFYIFRSKTSTVQIIPWGSYGDLPENTQDFDGDGLADPTVIRFNQGNNLKWYILQSSNGQARVESFGLDNSDYPIRGDFDGDGKADMAIYRCGPQGKTTWYKRSSDGASRAVQFGLCGSPNDLSVMGDFDGDSKTDIAVYRWSTAQWFWMRSSDGQVASVKFGIPQSDLPAMGDYDGDGKTDPAVFRNTGSGNPAYFHVLGSTSGYQVTQFGIGDDQVVAFPLFSH